MENAEKNNLLLAIARKLPGFELQGQAHNPMIIKELTEDPEASHIVVDFDPDAHGYFRVVYYEAFGDEGILATVHNLQQVYGAIEAWEALDKNYDRHR